MPQNLDDTSVDVGERISAERAAAFLADFRTMSGFGATEDGGVDRQAGTDADADQRRWLAGLLERRGFTVRYDRIGNQFGLWEATPGADFVVIGSHMDSQPTAGRFDGAYGVLAAAHAAFRLVDGWNAAGERPEHNIAVVNWFNEEGSRFVPSMMGSSVYTGVLGLEQALATTDHRDVSVQDELDRHGFRDDWDGPVAAACAEIHIEQGRLLENSDTTIGLVTATWAASKYVVTFDGEQAHSGATVMEDRKDALWAAAELVVFARRLADRFPGKLHTAIGQLDVYPNSPVVVASQVRLMLDLRSADVDELAQADALLAEEFVRIAELTGVHVDSRLSHRWGLNPYQPAGVEIARAVAAELAYPADEILTVAGHDSVNMKELVPTVMLFVPSVQGISHNVGEFTEDADMVAGLDVLTEVVRRLANAALTRPETRA